LSILLVVSAASSQVHYNRYQPTITVPGPGVCGDGLLDFDEDCDDGNTTDDDGCSSSCVGPLHWVGADPHVHDDGCEPPDLSLERLLPAARAAGLQIVSLLLWQGDLSERARSFTGLDHPASTRELILHRDVEVSGLPAAQTGHLMLLGLTPPLDPVLWTAHSSVAIVEQMRARQPRLLIGMAHAGWPDPRTLTFPAAPGAAVDLPVLAARGDLDFIAFELSLPKQPEHFDWIPLSNWIRLQNSGFRLPLLGASDYPCGNRIPGSTRSYVLIDGTPTYRKYLDAIRQGRVSVAVYGDDRLDLRIGTARIGDEVRAEPRINLRVESVLSTEDDVRVVVNGETAAVVHVPPGRQVRSVELTLRSSAWIHLRSRRAITNAIYVIVDGASIPRADRAICYFIDWIDHARQDESIELGSDRVVAHAAYHEARSILVDRLKSKDAKDCGW
jgi:cysteine-rich repeat protein